MSVITQATAAACLLTALSLMQPAQASVLSADPDAFADGAVLTNAFPGLTLRVQFLSGISSTAVVKSMSGYSDFNSRNLATTGTLVFGRDPTPEWYEPQWWDENNLGLLRGDFSVPVTHVSIDLIFDDDDGGYLKAFDSSDTLLATVFASGDGRRDTPFYSAVIARPQGDIAYFLAGGAERESIFLDNLNYSPVPLPPAILMSLTGLAALGLIGRNTARAG